ncbi:MAG TPA: OsmC family protein [Myxococcota bacterium]|nr:OsmC family protein [Myxococcota bacterium]
MGLKRLTVTFPGGKKVDGVYGNFTIHTDQPVDEGGEGTAPEPFTYMLASLGTCAGIYVVSYLRARDLPFEEVKLIQEHEWDEKAHRLTKVTMTILLPPGIPEKHKKPLIRSASRCTVKRLFESPPEFEINTKQEKE